MFQTGTRTTKQQRKTPPMLICKTIIEEMDMSATRCPTHPGEILQEDSLPALGLSVAAFVRALGVSRQMVHGILAERSAVSPEMALRLGAFFGYGPQLWIDMQTRRDLWLAEQRVAGHLPKAYAALVA